MNALVIPATLSALAYLLFYAARPEGAAPPLGSVLKTGATGLLAVAALSAGAPWAIGIGLLLGAAGDLALSRPGQGMFLAGMAAFAAGHMAYAAAFLPDIGGSTTMQWGAVAAVGLLVLSTELWLAPHTGRLRAAVRAYGAAIGLMAAAACLLPAGSGLLQAGVALFVLSDVLLAIRLFRATGPRPRQALGLAVWPCYWAGQALILAGALAL